MNFNRANKHRIIRIRERINREFKIPNKVQQTLNSQRIMNGIASAKSNMTN